MNKNKKLNKTIVFEYLMLTLGAFLVAAGDYFFKFPNNFSSGGIAGLSVIVHNLYPNIPAATYTLIFNIILLIIGFIFLGRGFGIRTVYCTLCFSIFVEILELVVPLTGLALPITNEKILELMFAVIIPSLGIAIAFKYGGSTGGTDIPAVIVRKYTNIDISVALFIADFVITSLSFFVIDVTTGLYSMFGLVIKSFVVQKAIDVLGKKKGLIIITTMSEEVSQYITSQIHRSATMWAGKGSYTHEDKVVLFAVMTSYQASQVKNYVHKIDNKAFVAILSSSEIYGKGFKSFTDSV